MLTTIIVETNHEGTLATLYVAVAATIVLVTLSVCIAVYLISRGRARADIRQAEFEARSAASKAEAKAAEANEKITNGRNADDFLAATKAAQDVASAMASSAQRQTAAVEAQTEAIERQGRAVLKLADDLSSATERFMTAQKKMEAFLAKDQEWRDAARDLAVK